MFEGPFVFGQLRRQAGKGLSRGKFAAPEPGQRPARKPGLHAGNWDFPDAPLRGLYARVRRLHPQADGNGHGEGNARTDGLKLPGRWDDTLSHALQQAPQKGVESASDLDAETERLYADHVVPQRGTTRIGAAGTRGVIRSVSGQSCLRFVGYAL